MCRPDVQVRSKGQATRAVCGRPRVGSRVREPERHRSAYMRYIEGCPIVFYNSFLADQQGEVDVVAVKPAQPGQPRVVYLCEVTTHIGGFNTKTTLRVDDKLARLREFANTTFPDEAHRFQWWSPVVANGATTTRFDGLCAAWTQEGAVAGVRDQRGVHAPHRRARAPRRPQPVGDQRTRLPDAADTHVASRRAPEALAAVDPRGELIAGRPDLKERGPLADVLSSGVREPVARHVIWQRHGTSARPLPLRTRRASQERPSLLAPER